MRVLNITNGDGAANLIKASEAEGDVLPWRDTMHHGPFPPGLGLDELSAVRARYFAGSNDDPTPFERDFRLRDEHLRAASDYDAVLLWYEHDLLDQLQVLQLLDWFADADLGATSVDLICIDRFEGVEPFRGIGQLDAGQMATLIGQRRPVSEAQKQLARAGWRAFRSHDPGALLAFMARDLSALPFLRAALRRHLEEYPAYQTGLTRSEEQILRLVADGVCTAHGLFEQNMALETALFIGDWPTFSIIADLCSGALLRCEPDNEFRFRPSEGASEASVRDQRFRITELGAQILAGHRDAFDCIRRDRWLGGVHLLCEKPMWVWNATTETLQIREP